MQARHAKSTQPIEDLVNQVQNLDREGLKTRLREFQHLPLDFTDAFLDAQSEDRLRHLLLAACIQARKGHRRH